MPKKRIAVLMGGPSSEYEISLATGRKILSALDPERYFAQPVIVTRERQWLIPPMVGLVSGGSLAEEFLPADSPGCSERNPSVPSPAGHSNILQNVGMSDAPPALGLVPRAEDQALRDMRQGGVDVVFIAMHGEFGEDGTVQGLLEAMGIPYTGSGVLASALGMDKPRAYAVFRDTGLAVPDFFAIDRGAWREAGEGIRSRAEAAFGFPLVVKPANRGSSVGITIAASSADAEAGVAEAFRHADRVILQRYIAGTEVQCGVLETDAGTIPLPPTEIVPKERAFFDYYSKYTPGATSEITPPRLPADTIRRIQKTALLAHQAIGAAGMSRTDMILGADGELYVLEINTIPGMTETSLLPQAAAAIGISFPKLLDTIIEAALRKQR